MEGQAAKRVWPEPPSAILQEPQATGWAFRPVLPKKLQAMFDGKGLCVNIPHSDFLLADLGSGGAKSLWFPGRMRFVPFPPHPFRNEIRRVKRNETHPSLGACVQRLGRARPHERNAHLAEGAATFPLYGRAQRVAQAKVNR